MMHTLGRSDTLRFFIFAVLVSTSAALAQITEPENGADQFITLGSSLTFDGRHPSIFNTFDWDFDNSGIAPLTDVDDAGPYTRTFNRLGTFTITYVRYFFGSTVTTDTMTVTVVPDIQIDTPGSLAVVAADASPDEWHSFSSTIPVPSGEPADFYEIEWVVGDYISPNQGLFRFPGEDPGRQELTPSGIYRVIVDATYLDADGVEVITRGAEQIDVVVANRPEVTIDQPAFNAGAPTIIPTGGTINLESTVTDIDYADGSIFDGPGNAQYTWRLAGAAPDESTEDPGSVTLSNFGAYTFTLEVRDRWDLLGVAADTVNNPLTREVIVSHEPVGNLTTSLGAGPVININEGDPIDLIAGGSTDQDNVLVPNSDDLTFVWSFTGPVAIDPFETDLPRDPVSGFLFPGPGTYTVTLTVRDSLGVVDQTPEVITVNVNDRPDATIVTPNSDQLIQPNTTVNFAGEVVDTDAVSLTYAWNFDGGVGTDNVEDPGDVSFPNAGIYDVTFQATDDMGAQSTPATVRVTASTPPDSSITAPLNNEVLEVASFINFAGTGTDPDDAVPLAYSWRIQGPGVDDTVTQQNFSRQYGTPGIYTATLTTTDQYNVPDATPAQITFVVNSFPNGDIAEPAADVVIGTGESVTFAGQAGDPDAGATFTYDWALPGGDPATSTLEDPGAVTYNTNGGYTATFTVRDNFNTADPTPATRQIRVSDRPDGSITAPADDVITVISGSTVSFAASATDADDNGSLTYEWDFGGAAVAMNGAAVNATFGTSGEFTVTMRARDGYGLVDGNPPSKTLRVTDAPDGEIIAPTTAASIAVAVGETLRFEGAFTDLDNNSPHTFLWDFGLLGRTNTNQSPGELQFDSVGSGLVTFTVTDGYGIADQDPPGLTVNVTNRPNGTILTPAEPQVTIVTGESVNFTAETTDADNSTPFTFAWDFDGGAAGSTVESPGATAFNTPGVYNVSFTGIDAFAIEDDTPDTVTVRVTNRPEGTILEPAQNVVIGVGESVTFRGEGSDSDSDISPGMAYTWDFGGVAPSSDQAEPGSVTFNNTGTFTVSLTVRDGFDVPDDTPETVTVTVGERPDGTITVPGTEEVVINPGEAVTFTASVSDPDNSTPYSYAWDFDIADQVFATPTTDPITFPDAGRYPVALTVTDTMTLADLSPDTLTVVVNDPPEGTINRTVLGELLDNNGELIAGLGDQLTLQAEASDPNTLSGLPANTSFTYAWSFTGPGVNQAFEGAAPGVLNLDTIGTYTLTLTVTDDRGQADLEPDSIAFRVNDDPDAVITQPELDLVVNPGESQFFAGTVSDTDGDNPVVANWNFGMNGVPDSSDLEPGLIEFLQPGQITVTLTATDALGLTSRQPATRIITVNDPPSIDLFEPGVEDGGLLPVEQGSTVDFFVSVSDENPLSGLPDEAPESLNLNWNFGALGSANTAGTDVQFTNRGEFPVTFTVRDSFGGTTTRTLTIASTTRPTGQIVSPDQDAPVVNLGEGLVFEAEGNDDDLPGGESLRFVWDFDGEQICASPPCPDPGDVVGTEDPGLILFEDDMNVPELIRRVEMNVYDNYGLANAEPAVVNVRVNRPPSGLQLVVYTPPGSSLWGSNRALVADRDTVDNGLHLQSLQTQPALGTVEVATETDGPRTFYDYNFINPNGNPNSNRVEDYGYFPFDVRVTDPNNVVLDGVGAAMILPEEFMFSMRDWPETAITDCLQPGSEDCADFVRGREIDSMVEILNAPHLVRNQPPTVVDDYFVYTVGPFQILDVLANDFDGNEDSLELINVPATSDLGVSLAAADVVQYQNRNFVGFDHFTYSVQERFPDNSLGTVIDGDVYLAVNTSTPPNLCNNATLLSWVPGVSEDDSVIQTNVGFTNEILPNCKPEFDGPEVWWAIRFPEDVPAVGFTIDTLPGNINDPIGDTVLQVYRVNQPGALANMCANRDLLDCSDNISGANLYSRFTHGNAQDFAGQVLLFMVDAVDAEQGTVQLNLTTLP
ncbi:PKD domain-containing protein [Acanthopleuribacter pedis]|uniref:PKD domain-containing protein n=1 Tax=Acanthopleuribacter pedis TaxID=442870 RepID=A0A8J7U5W2_9BACT|nr:PKD domain-containing protein [Acanthopleuribacter pedis]MBO1321269.1 PKD domain-containing protein [Acanthopleuribacter pedis]